MNHDCFRAEPLYTYRYRLILSIPATGLLIAFPLKTLTTRSSYASCALCVCVDTPVLRVQFVHLHKQIWQILLPLLLRHFCEIPINSPSLVDFVNDSFMAVQFPKASSSPSFAFDPVMMTDSVVVSLKDG